MNSIEHNKDTVTAFITALFSHGDLEAVDDYLAEDFVNHDPPLGVTADREGMRGVAEMFRGAFPDWRSDMAFLVGEGDLVAEVFTARGTQQGETFGVPASGRNVNLPGINVWRVRQGRISANTVQEHLSGAFDKLGVRSRGELVAAVLSGPR